MTGVTETDFHALLPQLAQAVETDTGPRTMDGQPRTRRRYSPDATCPLPTMADTLRFSLTDVQQNPLQDIQGQLFGMSQSNANTWIHLVPPVLHQALADPDLLPARPADGLAARLAKPKPAAPSTSPLFGMRVLNGRSSERKILRSKKDMTVARRRVTRANTSS
jgi:hypothetical protein